MQSGKMLRLPVLARAARMTPAAVTLSCFLQFNRVIQKDKNNALPDFKLYSYSTLI